MNPKRLEMKPLAAACLRFAAAILVATATSAAADWNRFRGSDGSGISSDTKVPVMWSESEHLKWKRDLPGRGSSSPIVVGGRVYVTCYSGSGMGDSDGGQGKDLQRHLLCLDGGSGQIVWSKTVAAELPEDPFRGYLTEHGYASNTPTSDGQRVYAFFGKSGVLAFDLDGNQLWRVGVGKESSNRQWGSGASPILYKDLLIVNAAEESQSIRALDKRTGREVWKAEGAVLELAYGTPALVDVGDGRQELVLGLPNEVWGLNPDTGKLKWHAATSLAGNICPSIVHQDGIVYAFGGYRSVGSIAIRAGGKGDVTQSHVVWSSSVTSYVATPLLHDGHLYWVDDRGLAYCLDAKTGTEVYRERLPAVIAGGKPVYASPVLAGGNLYVVSRWRGTYVLAAKPDSS
jgi:outer membrane protein assembly factor BamB